MVYANRITTVILTSFLVGSGYSPPSVPELDRYVVNLGDIQRTSSQEDVRVILGEPPFVHDTYGIGSLQYTTWRYPIRNVAAVPLPAGAQAQRWVIPAVELRIWLGESGVVDKWGFYHPIEHSPMQIRESIEEADYRLRKVCKPPTRIELARLLRQGATREDVLKGMHWFEGLVSAGLERSQMRTLREGQREILIYYADHPSPLYIPPYYLEVTYYGKGDAGTGWHFEGWGACK
ncbi:MAG: hypothetical protein IT393_02965 [Nitrospirae bacterium]|nr:hypothetical protein [Nitrospirota bacterium]